LNRGQKNEARDDDDGGLYKCQSVMWNDPTLKLVVTQTIKHLVFCYSHRCGYLSFKFQMLIQGKVLSGLTEEESESLLKRDAKEREELPPGKRTVRLAKKFRQTGINFRKLGTTKVEVQRREEEST